MEERCGIVIIKNKNFESKIQMWPFLVIFLLNFTLNGELNGLHMRVHISALSSLPLKPPFGSKGKINGDSNGISVQNEPKLA